MATRTKSVGDCKASASAKQTGIKATASSEAGLRSLPLDNAYRLADATSVAPPRLAATISHRGFLSGCEYGKALAEAFALHLQRRERHKGSSLQHFALSYADNLVAAGDDVAAWNWQRGQVIGFFSAVDALLERLIEQTGFRVTLTEQEILCRLKDAASGAPDKRYEAAIVREKSDQARDAANARWSKHRAREAANG